MTPEAWAQRVMSRIAQEENWRGRLLTDKEQTATIAAVFAEATPRWIPVAERLPEPGDETLLIFDGDVWAGTYASSYYGALDMEIPPRFMVGDGHELEHATHWMPRPPDP